MIFMDVKGKNVLITGGAGFIGSYLVEEYLANNAKRVIVFDDFSTGTMENLKHITDNRLKIIQGSILDENALNNVFKSEKIQIVDHLAAELEVYTGIRDTQRDARINIIGTLNILNKALQNNVKKVLFASSGAVYGEAKYLPINEEHPLEPHWPYGVSKLAAERYVMQYYKLFNLNTTAFRYGIVYGPREWFGRVLTMFIKRIYLENKSPVIFGDGRQTRDFVYVKDIAQAHIQAIKNEKSTGEVFNLGSGEGVSVEKLAKILVSMSNRKLDIIYDNPQEGTASSFQPDRVRLQGELKNFVLDCSKAAKILGWHPKTKFTDGIIEEVKWISANPKRWSGRPRV